MLWLNIIIFTTLPLYSLIHLLDKLYYIYILIWGSNFHWASLVAQWLRTHLSMHEMWVWLLGQENPLEKEMATHSSIHAGKSHGQRSLVGYSPWGCKRVGQDSATKQQQFSLDYMSQVLFPERFSYLYINFCPDFTSPVLSLKISWYLTGN